MLCGCTPIGNKYDQVTHCKQCDACNACWAIQMPVDIFPNLVTIFILMVLEPANQYKSNDVIFMQDN